MELIDVLDEEGNITSRVETKREVHNAGLWHRTAHVWIANSKGEVLLQHRSEEMESYPNMWDISVAGHISSGEDSRQGAVREIQEEIGLEVAPADLKLIGTTKKKTVINNGTYFDNEFSDIYLLNLDLDINDLHLQAEELKDLKWIAKEEFENWIREGSSDLVPHIEEFEILFKAL